jgi:HAD superfamily hydrolase (TIGR01509 family)
MDHIKIECVLFDLDGVLVDACDWHYDALNEALKTEGYPQIERNEHLTKYNGLPTRVKLKMLNMEDDEIEIVNNKKQKYTIDFIRNNAKIMEEKIELHEYLKSQNIKISCVTNSIEETAREMLMATGQFAYIDLLISNEKVKKNKPYPDCYNYAVNNIGVNPLNCLAVEDSPKGIESAVNSIVGHLWVVSDSTKVTKNNYLKFIKGEV